MFKNADTRQFLITSMKYNIKEVQIVYRLFLVNCYLLLVPRLPSQPASLIKRERGTVIILDELNSLEIAYICKLQTFVLTLQKINTMGQNPIRK